MVGENDESMTEKKRGNRLEIKQALEVMEQCKKELVKRGEKNEKMPEKKEVKK